MYWVFGDITDINAQFGDFNHAQSTDFEDTGIVSFQFVNGGMGSLNYSTSVFDKNSVFGFIPVATTTKSVSNFP